MRIKTIVNNTLNFIIKRFIELFGLITSIIGLLLLVSLISYSPEDPNFIFSDNLKVQNFLGFKGSFISDLFLQSLGLISILLPVTLFCSGIKIINSKKLFYLIENLFYSVLYCLVGSFFFAFFYNESFWLAINGNGGLLVKF